MTPLIKVITFALLATIAHTTPGTTGPPGKETDDPSLSPTESPTQPPAQSPTNSPIVVPSSYPTTSPTLTPSRLPTLLPTTTSPTANPTVKLTSSQACEGRAVAAFAASMPFLKATNGKNDFVLFFERHLNQGCSPYNG